MSFKICARCKKENDDCNFKTCQSCRKPKKVKCEYCDKEYHKKSIKSHQYKKHGIEDNLFYEQPEMTEEQIDIIDNILEGNHVRVFAKAGTGKTTMALTLSEKFYEKYSQNTLIVTYNRLLLDDVRNKTTDKNTQVENYHTLCGKLYGYTCKDDKVLRECLEKPFLKNPTWGLIIVDEAQDMGKIHYELISRVIESVKPIVLIMGDPFQRLYENRGEWYMNADNYFSHILGKKFINLHLSISFRISHEMANYINTNLNPNILAEKYNFNQKQKDDISFWWKDGIKANPKRKLEPESVKIVKKDKLKSSLENAYEKYPCIQTIVLGRGTNNIRGCLAKLSEIIDKKYGEPKIVNSKSSTKRDNRMRHYATIEQSKGLEFDFVCVPDFSNYWLSKTTHFDGDPLRMFNLYYVALSRAKKEVLICEIFFNESVFCTHKDYQCNGEENEKILGYCNVISLIEFVPVFDINFYKIISSKQIGRHLYGNTNIIGQGETYSVELSKYIGSALGYMKAIRTEKFTKITNGAFDFPQITNWIDSTSFNKKTSWLTVIKYSIARDILDTGLSYLWRQITDEIIHNSVNIDFLEKCIENVDIFLGNFDHVEPEKCIEYKTVLCDYIRKYNPLVYGRCDFLTDDSVIELKFSNNTLSNEHIEQILMYSALLQINGKNVKHAYLYYVNKGLCYELDLVIPYKEYIDRILLRKCGMCYETYCEELTQEKITQICRAIKKNGKQCRNKAKDNGYCGIKSHQKFIS